MNTNDKIKEVADDFILYYNDFIGDIEFADAFKHLAANPDNPLVIEHMHHWLQHRLEALVREEREEERERILKQLRRFGITAPSIQSPVLNISQFEAYINAPITNNKN